MTDSDDENYVIYGIPLDPLDEDNLPRKKPATIQDQYAVDEQGRRRFHGAFTGGFSAGYFNTVGSRDGWQPQQFKSSRSSKASNITQRPEDFMDDEDTSEFGIAPTGIRPTSDFQDHDRKGLKRYRAAQFNNEPIPGTPVLHDLLVPIRERIGIKLLKKMGWKPGQGIGPRVTVKEKARLKKQHEKLKMYGCSVPVQYKKSLASESESSDDTDDYSDIKFAPDDYEIYAPEPKDNYFGIGYVGLDKRPVLSQHINLFDTPTFHMEDKKKKLSIKGQGFGVGAFEADDEDIYSREDMSQYDFSLEPVKEKKSRWAEVNKKNTSSSCLENFVPAKNPLQLAKIYSPPVLPKDFKPVHVFRESRFYPPLERLPPSSEKEKRMLNAQSRARILTDPEVKVTTPAFNTIIRTLNLHGKEQTAERTRIELENTKTPSWMEKLKATSFVKGGVVGSDPTITGNLKKLEDFTKPFIADPDKQRRFEEYLEFSRNGQQQKLASIQPLSMTDWERDQERIEFEKVAKLQEQSSASSLSGTFIKSTTEVQKRMEHLSPDDQMKRAAQMKMFGKLTRVKTTWQPSSVVCKRFNVPEPKSGCAKPESGKKESKFSVFNSLDWTESSKFQKSSEVNTQLAIPVNSKIEVDVTEVNDNRSEQEKNFEATYEKVFGIATSKESNSSDDQLPTNLIARSAEYTEHRSEEKKDLFKAIFLSSSEDSESETEEKVDTEMVKSILIGQTEVNSQRNISPPRGIFASLDLETIATPVDKKKDSNKISVEDKRENVVNNDQKVNEHKNETLEEDNSSLPQDVYGPVLPSKMSRSGDTNNKTEESTLQRPIFRSVVVPKLDTVLSGKWVEKTKKSKKEKKKHKHKEHSKHKRKSKKHKR